LIGKPSAALIDCTAAPFRVLSRLNTGADHRSPQSTVPTPRRSRRSLSQLQPRCDRCPRYELRPRLASWQCAQRIKRSPRSLLSSFPLRALHLHPTSSADWGADCRTITSPFFGLGSSRAPSPAACSRERRCFRAASNCAPSLPSCRRPASSELARSAIRDSTSSASNQCSCLGAQLRGEIEDVVVKSSGVAVTEGESDHLTCRPTSATIADVDVFPGRGLGNGALVGDGRSASRNQRLRHCRKDAGAKCPSQTHVAWVLAQPKVMLVRSTQFSRPPDKLAICYEEPSAVLLGSILATQCCSLRAPDVIEFIACMLWLRCWFHCRVQKFESPHIPAFPPTHSASGATIGRGKSFRPCSR
jgi:hypothetical protein